MNTVKQLIFLTRELVFTNVNKFLSPPLNLIVCLRLIENLSDDPLVLVATVPPSALTGRMGHQTHWSNHHQLIFPIKSSEIQSIWSFSPLISPHPKNPNPYECKVLKGGCVIIHIYNHNSQFEPSWWLLIIITNTDILPRWPHIELDGRWSVGGRRVNGSFD